MYVEGVSFTRLYDRRAARILLILGVSCPRLDDKHRGFTDRLHSICDARFRGRSPRVQQKSHHCSSGHTHAQRDASASKYSYSFYFVFLVFFISQQCLCPCGCRCLHLRLRLCPHVWVRVRGCELYCVVLTRVSVFISPFFFFSKKCV